MYCACIDSLARVYVCVTTLKDEVKIWWYCLILYKLKTNVSFQYDIFLGCINMNTIRIAFVSVECSICSFLKNKKLYKFLPAHYHFSSWFNSSFPQCMSHWYLKQQCEKVIFHDQNKRKKIKKLLCRIKFWFVSDFLIGLLFVSLSNANYLKRSDDRF